MISKYLNTRKINESYTEITGDLRELRRIHDFLKVEEDGAFFNTAVKRGFKSAFKYFSVIKGLKDPTEQPALYVMSGHLPLLKSFGIESCPPEQKFSEEVLHEFIERTVKNLPFEPYDFQLNAFYDALRGSKSLNKLCTGSGKSLIIALIAEFMREQGINGILLVPNVNLLTQIYNDIEEYGFVELCENIRIIGDGNTEKILDKPLIISTWQSMSRYEGSLDTIEYVMADECHRFASHETSEIIKNSYNSYWKIGFTGTVPDSLEAKMSLLGLFGIPKTYIRTHELIQRGLGTPIKINSIVLEYPKDDLNILRNEKTYQKKIKYIKEYEPRTAFVSNLCSKVKRTGNTLLLFQHTEHGKDIFKKIFSELFPNEDTPENKQITGKKSFDFQKDHSLFFLNGEDDSKTREKTRKILEENDNAILVANYALLSTGVNIRKLHNMIFASPLKSFVTITQSIGRGVRKHSTKEIFTVYDIVDNTGVRKPTGIFWKQYMHRKEKVYAPEKFPVNETFWKLQDQG